MSFALRTILLVIVLTSASLLILLSISSANTSQLGKQYTWLVIANIFIAVTMISITLLLIRRAWLRYKRGIFGSKLMIRLAVAFAIIGIVPVTMVFMVSNQFLAKTIDTWFSNSVDIALDSGYALGRATLDAIKTDVVFQTKQVASNIEREPEKDLIKILDSFAKDNDFSEITVFNSAGSILAVRGSSKKLVPDIPSRALINQLRATGSLVQIESPLDKEAVLQVRALAFSKYLMNWEDELIVQWIEPIPEVLVRDLEALNKGFNEYEQLLLGKKGISQIYNITLIFTLLLALSGSLIASVLLSGWLVGPLKSLEKATRVVDLGDFRPLKTDKLNHELNDLLSSFNTMMSKLNLAQSVALDSARQLKTSSRFFEQILAHLTTGVMVFDKDWNLDQFNSSAQKILGCDLVENLDGPIEKINFLSKQKKYFEEISRKTHEKPFRIDGLRPDGSKLSLIITAFLLPNAAFDNNNRIILVFDDITALLEAQRTQAWADMARGLAHEIKNPLTPIMLSAERLQSKLSGKLEKDKEIILSKSTKMIVDQVAALKAMVDEFQQYARLPSANPVTIKLDEILIEFLQMYSSDGRIKFLNKLQGINSLVEFDRDQLLQVLHNLLQNAQDAIMDKSDGKIMIICETIEKKPNPRVSLVIEDNGLGINESILPKIFEPYTTTKFKGTGLGLAIVKKIVKENNAQISLNNKKDESGKISGVTARIEFLNIRKTKRM